MNSKFLIICPWCGNRWEQEEEEPRRCEVCRHYMWEGTHEEHMQFPDLEAWRIFTEKKQEEFNNQIDWDYRAHENPYD